jgi:hypothetical protein
MAAECAEIPLALVHLQIFFGRFQAVAHKNLYHFVLQWHPRGTNVGGCIQSLRSEYEGL